MRLCWYLFAAMLMSRSSSTELDGQNLLCNGNFENPRVPAGRQWNYFSNINIPCWTGSKDKIEFGKADFYLDGMQTQVMELSTDTKTLNQGFKQMVNLTKGTYTLKFDYAPRSKRISAPEVAMFVIYFNGKEMAKFRPGAYGIQTEELEVEGKDGNNIVEFVDASSDPGRGAVIDNVGLYAWKKNKFATKEIEAVSAGGIVTMSSIWDTNFDMYQLDRVLDWVEIEFSAWCSRNNTNQWIQVSTDTFKLWNSVIIQGRDNNTYVTSFKLMYTTDGFDFKDFQNAKVFSGNTNGSTKIRHNFQPFYALAIRLVPTGYTGHTCLRWGATYIVEE